MRKKFVWAIILALSAIVAGAKAQRYYLPEDLSFTGSQYVWESRALFELSDPDMWLYCEDGYAPALQYLPPFSELRHLLRHAYRSHVRWGYHGMIGYRVLTDAGYYFLSPLCDPIFLGLTILDDWVGRPLRMLYRTYADLSYLHFRVHAFDNIWRHHRFYDYYPRHGHRHYGWYDNHHCHVRPPRPVYRHAAPYRGSGRSSYGNAYRSNLRAGTSRSTPRHTETGSIKRIPSRSSSSLRNTEPIRRSSRSSTGTMPISRSSAAVSPGYVSGRNMRQSSVPQRSSRSVSSSRSESYRGSSVETRSARSGSSFERSGSVRTRSSSFVGSSRSSGYSNCSGVGSRSASGRR
jgi:hypothetical protein